MSIQIRQYIEQRIRNHDFFCEKELTMAVISGKYKVVIIWHLGNEGPLRYGKIFKLFPGISERIMTKQLRELEQDGIIGREVYPVVPPKVEYHLTDMGNTILPIVNDMWRWGKENMKFYYEKIMDKDKTMAKKAEARK